MIGSVSYWVTLAAMILVLKPLDLLFDLIFKKPAVNPGEITQRKKLMGLSALPLFRKIWKVIWLP